MEQNHKLIDLYKPKNLENLLHNSDTLEKYLLERHKMMQPDFKISIKHQSQIDALDNYIIDLLQRKEINKLNRADLQKYLLMVYQHSSNICFLRHSLLLSEPYVRQIYSGSMLNAIEERKQRASNQVKEVYEKLMKQEKVSDQELYRLLVFVSGSIGSKSEKVNNVLDNIFNYLLLKDSQGETLPFAAKHFMINMMSYYASKDLKIPYSNVYISNDNLMGQELKPTEHGANYGDFRLIYINKASLEKGLKKGKSLTSMQYFLSVISHEVRHGYQAEHQSSKKAELAIFETIKSDIFRKYLSTSTFDEYKQNYRFDGMEDDANKYGYRFLREILNRSNIKSKAFHNEIDTELISLQYKESLAHKRDTEKRMSKEKFDTEKLIQIIGDHSELLTTYPMLLTMFHGDGRVKNMKELFESVMTSENKIDSNKLQIAFDFIVREINMNMEQVSIERMPVKEQIIQLTFMFAVMQKELRSLKNSILIMGTDPIAFEKINKDRIERLNRYVRELNKHAVLIDHLASFERFGEEGRSLWIERYGINNSITSVKRSLKGKDSIVEMDIYPDLNNLIESEVIAGGPRI